MRSATGLVVVAIGAILRWAVDDNWDGIDLESVGLILMVVGAIAFITSVAKEFVMRPKVQPLPPAAVSPPPAMPSPMAPPPAPNPPQPK